MDEFLVCRSAQRLSVAPAECPSADQLAAALEEALPGPEMEAVQAHLENCEMCAAVAQDFVQLRDAATLCPPVIELLRATTGTPMPLIETHAAMCGGCAPIVAYGRTHQDEAAALIDLLEAESLVQALGAAVTATAVVAALLSRRAALGVAARGRVHRSRQGSLGTSVARPRHLTWTPFGLGEDTYEVALGELRMKTHDPSVEIEADAWSRLDVDAGVSYAWSVTALTNGKAVETREGVVSFLGDDEVAELQQKEAAIRQMPTERAMLALAQLYRAWNLNGEACEVLNAYVERNPSRPVGHLLLSQVFEEMDRVQEAAREMGQANRLLGAA